jgi:hypothetical protein
MPTFLDFIRGGSANQGAPVAGDLPSDGARASDIRSIFAGLSDFAAGVGGTINAFREGRKKNEQKPVVAPSPLNLSRWMPLVLLVVVGVGLWWFLTRK